MSDKIKVNLPDFDEKPRINPADKNVRSLFEIPDEPKPCRECGELGTAFDDARIRGISVQITSSQIERICPSCLYTTKQE